MKWIILILIGLAAPASAGQDYPYRDWGPTLVLDMSLDEATACVARTMGRWGEVTVIPLTDGNDIDVSAKAFWGPKLPAWETFKVRRAGDRATLEILYRHPTIKKGVDKDVGRLKKKCLRLSGDQESSVSPPLAADLSEGEDTAH